MSFNRNTDNKVFDPSKKFTVFGSWMNNYYIVKEKVGVEAACSLFEAIADYSMYDIVPDFSHFDDTTAQIVLQSIFEAIRPNIDNSRKKEKQTSPTGSRTNGNLW